MYLISRKESFAKFFFMVSFFGLVMYMVLVFYTFHAAFKFVKKSEITQMKIKGYPEPEIITLNRYDKDLKYILLWTVPGDAYNFSNDGQKVFIDNECVNLNCYVTANKTLLNGDVRNFDAIVFSINSLTKWKKYLPKERSDKQKYVFYSMVPADAHPICNVKADDFFNWTWSYKLYSDISTPFIEVKDLKGNVVAPSTEVEWASDMAMTLNHSGQITKPKAMMWYREKCGNNIHSIIYAKQLQLRMKDHALVFDRFGCNGKKCPEGGCLKAIRANYSFYLAFEDVITDDYVTKEVLKALENNAVPVVVGGADYSKFLPPGSYIDARYETPERLAALIEYIARNPSTYNKYFAWKNYYTIREAKPERGYCHLCALLNDKERMATHSSYDAFRKWWYYGSLKEKCYPKGVESFDDVLSYINDSAVRKNYILPAI